MPRESFAAALQQSLLPRSVPTVHADMFDLALADMLCGYFIIHWHVSYTGEILGMTLDEGEQNVSATCCLMNVISHTLPHSIHPELGYMSS